MPGADLHRARCHRLPGAALAALAEAGSEAANRSHKPSTNWRRPLPHPSSSPPERNDTIDIDELIDRLPLEAKLRLLSGETAWTTYAEPAIGLRSMVLSDGPVGVRGTSWDERDWGATTPSSTALAASWDPELVEEIGELLGAEARRKSVDVLLAPTVNLHRTPYGGRHFECLSEDPYLTAQIATAYVTGVQGSGVGATVKHYVANDSETERMTYEAVIDEQTLHELYLRPFEDIVAAAHPWLVMAAYNAVNGPTMTENALLTDPLHTRWGFDGVVVSDWNAIRTTIASARAAQRSGDAGARHAVDGRQAAGRRSYRRRRRGPGRPQVAPALTSGCTRWRAEGHATVDPPAHRRADGTPRCCARGGRGGRGARPQRRRAAPRHASDTSGRGARARRGAHPRAGRRQRMGRAALHGVTARRPPQRAG